MNYNTLIEELGFSFVIGIHPFTKNSRLDKNWTQINWAKTIKLILDKFRDDNGVKIVMSGSEAENGYICDIVWKLDESYETNILTAINLPVDELGRLIQRYNLFITLDTFPMHIAISMKKPTIALVKKLIIPIVIPPNNTDIIALELESVTPQNILDEVNKIFTVIQQ